VITELIEPTSLMNQPVNVDNTLPAVEPVELLGIGFHPLSFHSAVQLIERWVLEKKPRQICLANAYSVSLCWEFPEYRKTLDESDLVLADGMSIVWGGRWLGVRIPERVAGPDLSQALFQRAEAQGFGIFLLGSTPDTLDCLRSALIRRWPRLRIVGTHSPSMDTTFSSAENDAIIGIVKKAKPDFLFVGMSAPKQELWIAAQLAWLEVPVCMGIGAAFDFLSEKIPRAPAFLQRSGFEWLYRLYREPRRLWKRYLLGNFIFLSHLTWAAFRLKVLSRF